MSKSRPAAKFTSIQNSLRKLALNHSKSCSETRVQKEFKQRKQFQGIKSGTITWLNRSSNRTVPHYHCLKDTQSTHATRIQDGFRPDLIPRLPPQTSIKIVITPHSDIIICLGSWDHPMVLGIRYCCHKADSL